MNLRGNSIGAEGAKQLAEALRVNTALTFCNVLKNRMDVASAQLLVESVKGKEVSLAGIKSDQTVAHFAGNGLGEADAVLLASDLSKAGVSGALTRLDVSFNSMKSEGVKLLREAVGGRANFELIDEYN